MMMDYFSLKYQHYRQLLPSQIVKILKKRNLQRSYPSEGLNTDNLSFVLSKLGFGIKAYNSITDEDDEFEPYQREDFLSLFKTYVYSGFPLITITDDHAFLTIGIENTDLDNPNPRYVVQDDNEYPYKLMSLTDNIKGFIVPMTEKTFLTADYLSPWDTLDIINDEINLQKDIESWKTSNNYLVHSFLTTSRSFKAHCRVQNNVCGEIFIGVAMPKFVWVSEFIDKANLSEDPNKIIVDTLLIYDATDNYLSDRKLVGAKIGDALVLLEEDDSPYRRRNYSVLLNIKDRFTHFNRNLKGNHNNWQM